MTICVKHFNQVLVYAIICPRLSDARLIVRRLTVPRLYVRTPNTCMPTPVDAETTLTIAIYVSQSSFRRCLRPNSIEIEKMT